MTQSSIKSTLISLLNRIDAIRDGGSLCPFNTIAIWNNQINRMKSGEGYSFLSPAAFLETKSLNHERFGLGYNAYDLDITIHIVDEQLDANGDGILSGLNTNLAVLDQNLEVFHLRDLVIQYLDMFKPVQMGNIFFTGGSQDKSHDNVYHYQVTFRGRMVDPVANTYPNEGTGTFSVHYNYIWKSENFGANPDGSTFSIP